MYNIFLIIDEKLDIIDNKSNENLKLETKVSKLEAKINSNTIFIIF